MKRAHLDLGWIDIGQHFTIFPDGVILTGRPLNSTPSCIKFANKYAICIENLGNFDIGGDTMNSAQADSIFMATAAILKKIGQPTATKTNTVYHHWYDGSGNLVYHGSGQKSCPGTNFFGGNQLSDFEANFLPRLQTAMGGGGVAPVGLSDWVSVTAENLNIRSGPSSDHGIVSEQGPLSYGTVVRAYEVSTNSWIRVSQSKPLWIYGRYTRPVQRKVVNTADTNVRIGPGTEHDIFEVLQPGEEVFVLSTDGSWSQIADELWVHSSLLDAA